MAQFKLNEKAKLFEVLKKENSEWWQNLKNDPEIYIDIRMDNCINAYYNGGSIIKLKYTNGYSGEISFKYVPTQSEKNRIPFIFDENQVRFAKDIQVASDVLSREWLKKVKTRIKQFFPTESEKAIQGKYVLKNPSFIDTELQINQEARIDLVWLDRNTEKIYFVELKTIGDPRINFDLGLKVDVEKIHLQMEKYSKYLQQHQLDLLNHYKRLLKIKSGLGIFRKGFIMPEDFTKYKIETRPILLVGDCTNKWIRENYKNINQMISSCAYGAIYHGKGTTNFKIPEKTEGHVYKS